MAAGTHADFVQLDKKPIPQFGVTFWYFHLHLNTLHINFLRKETTTNKAKCTTKCSPATDGQCQIATAQQATGQQLIHLLKLMNFLNTIKTDAAFYQKLQSSFMFAECSGYN